MEHMRLLFSHDDLGRWAPDQEGAMSPEALALAYSYPELSGAQTWVRANFVSTLDGSRHDATIYGEAMDSADKATNKAMSAAYKYAVLLTFCIPTEGDNDADAKTHEVLLSTKSFAEKFPTQAQAIQEKLKAAPAQSSKPTIASPAPVVAQPEAFTRDVAAAWSEMIGLSESVRECSDTLNRMEDDPAVDLFAKTQLREEGRKKVLALRAVKVAP